MGSAYDFILLPLYYMCIKRIGGQGSPRFLTPMVKSFSVNLLTALESYWTESHLEFLKHQQRSSSVKVCGAPLSDWANGGNADGLHV